MTKEMKFSKFTQRVTVLFVFYAFTFSILIPNMDLISTGVSGSESLTVAENHFCVIANGSCKHGESCPSKHLHKKIVTKEVTTNSHDSHSDHVMAERVKSNDNKKVALIIGSSCHSKSDSSVVGVITDRFLVSLKEEFHVFSIQSSLASVSDNIYISHIMDTPFRPPTFS